MLEIRKYDIAPDPRYQELNVENKTAGWMFYRVYSFPYSLLPGVNLN